MSLNSRNAEFGWVYCLINPMDTTKVKIGFTSLRLEERLKQANNTFIADDYYIGIAKYVRKPYEREQSIHRILERTRYRHDREFFVVNGETDFKKILQIFSLMDGDEHPDSKKRLYYRNPYKLNVNNDHDHEHGINENNQNNENNDIQQNHQNIHQNSNVNTNQNIHQNSNVNTNQNIHQNSNVNTNKNMSVEKQRMYDFLSSFEYIE